MSSLFTKHVRVQQVLHVGCGPARLSSMPRYFHTGSWNELRLDIDESAEPDVVGTMLDMGLVGDETVDAVYSSHNIEHVFPHEVLTALGEFHRVLRPRGFAVVLCPNIQAVAEAVAGGNLMDPLYISPAGPISAIDILYGHRAAIAAGKIYMAHKTGFTSATLASHLKAAGFKSVVVATDKMFGLHSLAYKSVRDEQSMEEDCRGCFPAREMLTDVAVYE
jgi:SAM-dependent methyltransferase